MAIIYYMPTMCPNHLYIISDSYANSAGKILKAPFRDKGANT